MLRDIAMTVSVLISIVSVGFGVFKNIEAGNNRAFIYEQAYDIIGTIQEADIPVQTKAQMTNDALSKISAPPPVIDLSQSSADVGDNASACTYEKQQECTRLADALGRENVACAKSKEPTGPLCAQASRTRTMVISEGCFTCFAQ